MTETILRRPEVEKRSGLSRSTIYLYMTEGRFPRPVRLGKRAVGWRDSDIRRWLDELSDTNVDDPHFSSNSEVQSTF
jgi:prophage regulatory protein